jgi:hypothetical protein
MNDASKLMGEAIDVKTDAKNNSTGEEIAVLGLN